MLAVVRLLLLAAVLTFGVRSHARADGVRVDTQVNPCVPLDRERFVYLLGIELGSAAASDTAATLTLSCSDNLIQLSVQDIVTRKVVSRSVDITTVAPSERERLMALTASELVLASFLEVGMEPRAVIPPAGSAPRPALQKQVSEVVAARVNSTPPMRLGADVTTATFLSAMAPIFGLALHLTQPFSRTWVWNISLVAGRGSLEGTLGQTQAQRVSVTATTAALAWSARYTRPLGPFDVWAGLAGIFGMAYLKGAPAGKLESTPVYAPWAGPALQLAAAYRAGLRMRILLQLEAGLLLLGTRANVAANEAMNEKLVLELRGGWLGVNLGFDYAL